MKLFNLKESYRKALEEACRFICKLTNANASYCPYFSLNDKQKKELKCNICPTDETRRIKCWERYFMEKSK